MKKLLWLLGTLITSVAMGVGLIQPEEKVFTPGQYYQGNQNPDGPDWRGIYLNQVGGSYSASQVSDRSMKPLGAEETVFVPDTPSGLAWFWAVKKSSVLSTDLGNDILIDSYGGGKMSLVKGLPKFNYNKITFKVPVGTRLVAPANAQLVSSSQNSDGAYPEVSNTKGKYMQLIVKQGNIAYRITYGDMLMWWSDMNKTEPDDHKNDDPNQPVYNHTIAFSDQDRFDYGSVIGVSGVSGRTAQERTTNKDTAFVTISLEKSEIKDGIITEVWYPVNIVDFYQIGGKQK